MVREINEPAVDEDEDLPDIRSDLFVEDGRPLLFHVTLGRHRLKTRRAIERGGGQVTDIPQKAWLKLVNPLDKSVDPGTYSFEYIFDSIRANKLVSYAPYKQTLGNKPVGKRTTNRTQFTKEDDDLLRKLLETAVAPTSRYLYSNFAEKYPQHTADSWLNRAKKHIIPEMAQNGTLCKTLTPTSTPTINKSPVRPRTNSSSSLIDPSESLSPAVDPILRADTTSSPQPKPNTSPNEFALALAKANSAMKNGLATSKSPPRSSISRQSSNHSSPASSSPRNSIKSILISQKRTRQLSDEEDDDDEPQESFKLSTVGMAEKLKRKKQAATESGDGKVGDISPADTDDRIIEEDLKGDGRLKIQLMMGEDLNPDTWSDEDEPDQRSSNESDNREDLPTQQSLIGNSALENENSSGPYTEILSQVSPTRKQRLELKQTRHLASWTRTPVKNVTVVQKSQEVSNPDGNKQATNRTRDDSGSNNGKSQESLQNGAKQHSSSQTSPGGRNVDRSGIASSSRSVGTIVEREKSLMERYQEDYKRLCAFYIGRFCKALGRKLTMREISTAHFMCSGRLDLIPKLLEVGFNREKLTKKDANNVFLKEEDDILSGSDSDLIEGVIAKKTTYAVASRNTFLSAFREGLN
ncbi:hypothetical protein HK098_003752 [Nowakowskiella sp. JEL0407]|nr:hypothetical protein HK098_003752 [Nowakowskiella sp. JEL0407]